MSDFLRDLLELSELELEELELDLDLDLELDLERLLVVSILGVLTSASSTAGLDFLGGGFEDLEGPGFGDRDLLDLLVRSAERDRDLELEVDRVFLYSLNLLLRSESSLIWETLSFCSILLTAFSRKSSLEINSLINFFGSLWEEESFEAFRVVLSSSSSFAGGAFEGLEGPGFGELLGLSSERVLDLDLDLIWGAFSSALIASQSHAG